MQVNGEDFEKVKGAEGSGEVSKVSRPRNRTESIEGGRNLTSGRVKKGDKHKKGGGQCRVMVWGRINSL